MSGNNNFSGDASVNSGGNQSSAHRNITSAGTVNNERNRDRVDLMIGTNINDDANKQSSVDVWNVANSKTDSDKPLLPKSTILKALAEAVRSYQSVGVIIAEYTYQPQPNTMITKSQPALAFVLDYLLPSSEQNPDRDCSSGARMLIAALSAATDSQITQFTVVSEVRAAILRALSWPEIPEKHQQLQLLTALIPTMIENCPPDNPALMRMHQHQPRRNDIFNIMVRNGLITDLANITQSLDLSSPNTVLTIGTALKSLEQLLRMSNQPITPISLQLNSNKNRNDTNENDGNSNAATTAEDRADDRAAAIAAIRSNNDVVVPTSDTEALVALVRDHSTRQRNMARQRELFRAQRDLARTTRARELARSSVNELDAQIDSALALLRSNERAPTLQSSSNSPAGIDNHQSDDDDNDDGIRTDLNRIDAQIASTLAELHQSDDEENDEAIRTDLNRIDAQIASTLAELHQSDDDDNDERERAGVNRLDAQIASALGGLHPTNPFPNPSLSVAMPIYPYQLGLHEAEEIEAAEAGDAVPQSILNVVADESGGEDNVQAERIISIDDLHLLNMPNETLVSGEDLMERFEQLIDEAQPGPQQRSLISSGAATRGSISTSVVTAGSSGSTGGSMQPIELADERYIHLEEDDTSSDSESNGSEENDEEREEEMDDDENEDEAEDRSDLEVDEETRQFIDMYDHVYGRHLSPSIPELERDSEDILMIQYANGERDVGAGAGNGNSVGINVNVNDEAPDLVSNNVLPSGSGGSSSGANANNGSNGSSRFLLHTEFPNIFEANNMSRHDESVSGNGDGSNESAAPGSPSGTSVRIGGLHISTGNVRPNVVGGGSGGAGASSQNQTNSLSQLIQFRTPRTNRHRRCAYLNLNGRNSNPPAILQRLLGPSVAQNVNLGQVIANANGSASFRDATRVVVMDNGFGIFANAGEPSIDLVDQAGYLFGRSLAATLNSTPSPLHWWLEEAKVLGLESQADVCLTVCNDLIPDLERQRTLELSKTRNKRKKKSTGDSAATTATGAQKQQPKNTNVTDTTTSSQYVVGDGSHANVSVTAATTDATRTNLPAGDTASGIVVNDATQSNVESEECDQHLVTAVMSSPIREHLSTCTIASPTAPEHAVTMYQHVPSRHLLVALGTRGGDTDAVDEEPYDSEEEDESDREPYDSEDTEEDEHRTNENHIAASRRLRRRPNVPTVREEVDSREPDDIDTREEITESDDGSVSDGGRSITSSVSADRFLQVKNNCRFVDLMIPFKIEYFHLQQPQQPTQTAEAVIQPLADAVQPLPSTTQQSTDEQQPAVDAQHSAKAPLLSYDELETGVESANIDESALPLPSIDTLQPLAISFNPLPTVSIATPTTSASSTSVSDANAETTLSESAYDEVEQILKAIKGEFKEQDIIVIDGDNTGTYICVCLAICNCMNAMPVEYCCSF